ncbi:phasin family protein [Massilia sp. METH4]|uniref:phasin family protein n=1 Tax=Massilia sp. METH4 TaxID=3123041 RepID=UPI0030D283AA
MFPFSQSITPAAKNHVQAQVSFFNDMSRSLFQMAQQFNEVNLQLAQKWLEDAASTSQAIITADKPTEVFSVTAARAQPAADRFRAWQQQLSKIAADSQTRLVRVASEHADETARAAREFTDEVTRVTSEETERTLRQQHDTMRQLANPLDSMVDSATRQARAAMGNGHDLASQATQAAQAAARAATGQQQRKEGQPS